MTRSRAPQHRARPQTRGSFPSSRHNSADPRMSPISVFTSESSSGQSRWAHLRLGVLIRVETLRPVFVNPKFEALPHQFVNDFAHGICGCITRSLEAFF